MRTEFINREFDKISVGMGASGTYWTDHTPFEVVKVVSDKTVDIRELDYELISGSEFDGSAEYKYYINENKPITRVRRCKRGWRTADGMRICFGYARRYYDPSF